MAALLFPILILVLFWAFVLRPQQRRQREHAEFLDGLGVGDDVVTLAGMFGTITELSDKTVRLRIAPEVIVTVARAAIGHRQEDLPGLDPAHVDVRDDRSVDAPADAERPLDSGSTGPDHQ